TLTPMGGRLLHRWINQPLLDRQALEERLTAVELCLQNLPKRTALRAQLRGLGDLERITGRIVQGVAGPRELLGLKAALGRIAEIRTLVGELVSETTIPDIENVYPFDGEPLDPCPEVADLISRAIVEDPPATLANGGVIRRGYSEELDGIVDSVAHAKKWVASLERVERERTGIKTLKVGFNKVFGYYIEVTKANLEAVPP
ncbi:MAG: DNA mismatch repair protein MutS, partial [Chloroflexi bacterium]|nr:DNA mismatch repair protein MutS [Chloroflexota bacterium]